MHDVHEVAKRLAALLVLRRLDEARVLLDESSARSPGFAATVRAKSWKALGLERPT